MCDQQGDVAAILIGYPLSGRTGMIWGIALISWPAILMLLITAYRRGWIDPIREIAMVPVAFFAIALGFAEHWLLRWIRVLI